MNKAFIFDMDGVVVDSENVWQSRDNGFFGKSMNDKIKDQILGSTVHVIYELARDNGLQMSQEEFFSRYNELAKSVYAEAKLTNGITQMLEELKSLGFKIGLVTSSPMLWANWVLKKLPENSFDYILSIGDNLEISSKPEPDGYIKAMKVLGSDPGNTIILEDSSNGIKSAKASGSAAICLLENLPPGYRPAGADKYAENLAEVLRYVEDLKL